MSKSCIRRLFVLGANPAARCGVSLLEIIIACMITAFAMIPIAAIMGTGHRGTQKDFRRVEAIHFAQGAMNEALKLPFQQLSEGTYTTTLVAASGSVRLGSIQTQIGSYSVQLRVTPFPITFRYQPVDINAAGYVASDPVTWTFLPETDAGGIFDGSSALRPIMLRRVHVTVTWKEPNNVVPPPIELVSLKANLNQ